MGNSPRYVGFIDPPYIVTLTDDSGAALDLTGCTSGSFTLTMLNQNTNLAQQGVGVWTVANQTTNKGQASYQWTNADMATAGPWWIYSTVKLPAEPSPREFDPELILILAGTVGAGAAPPGVLPAPIAKAIFFNGADYGVVGDGSDQTAAFNTTLAAAHAAGGGIAYIDAPNVTISAPLRIYSNTTLMLSPKTTVTLAANSNCNMLQNYGVQANRRITDGVTNSTTTFTSATASFASGDVGKAIRIYYQNGTFLDTTIASVTNSTTARLATAATFSQTGLYASIGAGRDSNITVLGGLWKRPAPNGPGTHIGDTFRFRHCDTLEIGKIGGLTADGGFFVSVGDCTVFHVYDITPSATASDTVHINGPSSVGLVERIDNPAPGDDVVALTCGDTGAYNEIMGNITDVTVQGVRAPFEVKLLAGSSTAGNGYLLDRITVRDVKCTLFNSYAINIADDTGSSTTQGGTWGRIVLDGISNTNLTNTFPAVNATLHTASVIQDLEIRNTSCASPSATSWVIVQAGTTVTRLMTDIDRSRVSFSGSAKVMTWISNGQPLETPLSQPAVAYGDGSSVSATVTDNAVLDITGALSIELWLNPSSSQVAFWTPIAKIGQYWMEGGASGQVYLTFTIVSGGINTATTTTTLRAGHLNYVVGTFVPSTSVNTYVDGLLSTSTTTSIPATVDTSTNPLYLFNRQSFSRYTAGQIADVRLWNGALSANDIAHHYADPGNLAVTSGATLAARWKCDEGSGTTLNDSSGNGNNATLSSASWNPPATPYLVQPLLATGAAHTVDDVIAALQKIGIVRQS